MTPDTPARSRPSPGLLAGLGLLIVVLAAAGYWWTSGRGAAASSAAAPAATESGPAAAAQPSAEQASEAAAARAQFEAMAAEIKARTDSNPQDAEAWGMLARAYTLLERPADAIAAFERASALRAPDASLLVDHANALAMKNGSRIGPDAAALIEQALTLDPDHVKGLAMGGSAALTARNPALAVQRWERLSGLLPPEHELQTPLRNSIAAARAMQLEGAAAAATPGANAGATQAPPAESNTGTAPAAADGKAANPAAASVSGRVSLAPALAARAAPEDTVFIVARAEPGAQQGARMPLAILRRQVKDLPLEFTLDDSLSMSPAARLSGAQRVIVVARVSRSGNAMPQPGDLSGQSAPVDVGTSGVAVEIAQVVGQ